MKRKLEEQANKDRPQIDDPTGIFDDARFIEQMGTSKYIEFKDFAKIMSLFNPRTGIDEKI